MKYIVTKQLEIRTEPSFENGEVYGVLHPGFVIDIDDWAEGQSIDNLNDWLKDNNGFYYWSDALEFHSTVNTIVPTTNPMNIVYPYWMTELNIPKIWRKYTGNSVGVAVIDTGISLSNNDLPFSSKYFLYDKKSSIGDKDGHGTHCAGLIGAKNTNGFAIGVAPNCNLFVCKIAEHGYISDFMRYVKAIEWCSQQDEIHIISISWASFISDPTILNLMQNAVDNAINKGKIIVCAIGNGSQFPDNSKVYPASLENTIGVGAIPIAGVLYPYLNKNLLISTYGHNIESYNNINKIIPMTGTSQACPIIAGILALKCEQSKFNFSHIQAVAFLKTVSTVQQFTINNHKIKLPVLDGAKLLYQL